MKKDFATYKQFVGQAHRLPKEKTAGGALAL